MTRHPLRRVVQTISWLAIVGTILPSILFLFERISLPYCQWVMLLATIVWFVATPLWMGREQAGAGEAAGTS